MGGGPLLWVAGRCGPLRCRLTPDPNLFACLLTTQEREREREALRVKMQKRQDEIRKRKQEADQIRARQTQKAVIKRLQDRYLEHSRVVKAYHKQQEAVLQAHNTLKGMQEDLGEGRAGTPVPPSPLACRLCCRCLLSTLCDPHG